MCSRRCDATGPANPRDFCPGTPAETTEGDVYEATGHYRSGAGGPRAHGIHGHGTINHPTFAMPKPAGRAVFVRSPNFILDWALKTGKVGQQSIPETAQ
jgi:hypothetical protein